MDPQMLSLYPDGIRALLVDDDARFLKPATMLLSLLNFKVSTCGSPSSALKLLTADDKFKEIDVVLADAYKAATCGFDLKAIVEPDLGVPVLYFLSQNNRSAGAEADALLRTLDKASFILKKPFDADEVCNLWRDIAWRKCCLNGSRMGGGDVGQGSSSGGNGLLLRPWAKWPPGDDGKEEERVHFKLVRGVKKGRKRKGVSGGRRGHPAKNGEQTDVAGQEMDLMAQHVPRKCRSKKAKNGESASMLEPPEAMVDVEPQPPEAMVDVEPQPPQPKQSQSVLQTLDVPSYNPSIFADAVERDSNAISFSSSGGHTAAVAPAAPFPVFSAPALTPPPACQASTAPAQPPAYQAPTAPAPPLAYQAPTAPAPPPAYQAPPPAYQAPTAPAPPPAYQAPTAPAPPPAYQATPVPAPAAVRPTPSLPVAHQQQQTPAGNVVSNIAPPEAATTMSTSLTDEEAALPLPHQLARGFGPFPYKGPVPPPAVQQDMFAPRMLATNNIQLPFHQPPIAASDPFTGTVGGAAIGAAGDATHAGGYYGNTASTLMQSLQLSGTAQYQDEVAEMMATYNTTADPYLMVPQHVDDDVAAMFYNDNGETFVAAPPDQVLGMDYGVNDQAMAGGAFDWNAAAYMAPQGFGAAPNVNQLAMGGDLQAMVASDGNDDDYSFPLQALMEIDDMQMYDVGLAGQQGGATEAAAADVDAVETYLNDGEGGMENWGMGPADGIDTLEDMLMNNDGINLFPDYMNNGRE